MPLTKIPRNAVIGPGLDGAQCGFRPSISTADQIFTLPKTFERSWEHAKDVYICLSTSTMHTIGFLAKNFGKCCGSTVLTAACYWLESQYFYSEVCVRVGEVKSQPFTLGVGLRQGCVLSPLFIEYMNWIESHSWIDEGVTLGSCRINRLHFADDLVLLASSSRQGVKHALGWFCAACAQAGMQISTRKTEVLCSSRKPTQCMLLVSGGEWAAHLRQMSLRLFTIVFRDSSLYPKELSLFCLLWLISAQFAKTLVWKTWIDVKLWRHKQRTPNTNDTIRDWMKPPHENFLRTPLPAVSSYL